MFIGMGSFDFVRMERANVRESMGFGANDENSRKKDHFDVISKQDIIDAGGTYELVGRFSAVVNYQTLSKEAVNKIIDTICSKVSNDLGYEISLTRRMRELLHKHSSSKYGCRQIDSIIRDSAVTMLLDEKKRGRIETTRVIKLDVPKYEIEVG